MQAFGRLRFERCARQQGRQETPLELRLDQLIKFRDEWQRADAEAERKRIAAEEEIATAEKRKKMALRCRQATDADAMCQDFERRRAQSRGAADEEHRQVVQRIFEIVEAAKQQG